MQKLKDYSLTTYPKLNFPAPFNYQGKEIKWWNLFLHEIIIPVYHIKKKPLGIILKIFICIMGDKG